MKTESKEKTIQELRTENEELRIQLSEAQETLEAIQNGEVDALVVNTDSGKQVFTLKGADHSYRELVENMNEGVVTIAPDHTVMYCNSRFGNMLRLSGEKITGRLIEQFIYQDDLPSFISFITNTKTGLKSIDIRFNTSDDTIIPVLLSCSPFSSESTETWLIFTELTELKKIQGELKRTNEYLEELVEKRTFELKKKNEDLQISEARFTLALRNAQIGLAYQDRNLVYTWAYNQKSRSSEEIVGKTDAELFAPEDLEWIIPVKKEILESGKEMYVEKWLTSKGRRFYLGISYEPLKDVHDNIIGIGMATVDLTERKKAEEAIAASENEFRLLTESMPQIVWTTTADGQNTYFNHQWIDYTGLTLEESYGHGWNKPFHPDDQKRAWDAWQNAVHHNAAYLLQCRLRRFDGVYRWWLIHGVPVVDKEGTITKWYGTCTDIDEMKNAGDAILHNEQLLHSVIENVSSGVALIDEAGMFVVYNPVFLKLFGLSPDSTIKNVNDQDWSQWKVFDENKNLLHVDDHPVRKAAMTGKLVKNQLVAMKLPSGGDHIWMMISAEPIMKENGKIDKIICTYHDITERIKAEETLNTMSTLLSESQKIAHLGSFEFVAETQTTGWSEEEFRIYGLDPAGPSPQYEEMLAHCIHPDDAQLLHETFAKAMNTGTVYELEHRIVRPDGSVRFVYDLAHPYFDANGKLLKYVGATLDITERKKAEEALRESQALLNAILERLPDGVFLKDAQSRIIMANPATLRIIGKSLEEVIGKNDCEHYADPKVGRAIMENDLRIMESGETEIIEEVGLTPDGYRTFLSTKLPWRDAEGRVVGLLGITRDITERKKAEEALRESEKKLSDIYSSMTEGLALHEIVNDDSGKAIDYLITEVNPAYENITGLSRKSIIGKKATEVYSVEMAPYIEMYSRVTLSGKPETFETYFPPMDKHFLISVFSPAKGKFATIFQDISERKLGEIALKEAQEKLDIALESGNIGIWEWNLNTDEIYWDKKTEAMVGAGDGSNIKRSFKDFEAIINEEDLPHIQKAIKNAIEENIPLDTVYRIKSTVNGNNYVNAKAMVSKNDRGEPARMLGVIIDITEMKTSADKALYKLNEELLRSNKELQNFAYVASHDLQEPLRMVSNFTQLLKQRYKDQLDGDAHDYINFAVEGANRMYKLINDLLEYSRIETRGNSFTSVDMNSVMKQVEIILSVTINERNATISCDELPHITGDESQIIQLMQNLIGNAIKFSKENPRINISCGQKKNKYIFSVKDEGIGIDKQYFERIFKIFQKLHTKEEYEGTGIGLAICKRIVERHGGEIWVESEPGKGTIFYFSIPAKGVSI